MTAPVFGQVAWGASPWGFTDAPVVTISGGFTITGMGSRDHVMIAPAPLPPLVAFAQVRSLLWTGDAVMTLTGPAQVHVLTGSPRIVLIGAEKPTALKGQP